MKTKKRYQYLVVGAGPAGLCAVAKLIGLNIPPRKILWVDPEFKAGDFGTLLSAGSSVPGNTKVESYLKLISAVNEIIQSKGLSPLMTNEIDFIESDKVCSLNIAAEPIIKQIEQLRTLVGSIDGKVLDIIEKNDGVLASIQTKAGDNIKIIADHAILATGSVPKTIDLKLSQRKEIIDCTTVFIQSKLKLFLQDNPSVKSVAVLGSSHSAALCVMQLLMAGCQVHHFMIGEYRYAESKISDTGERYTKYDNTGLKGEVAEFTKKMENKEYIKHTAEDKDQIHKLINGFQNKFSHIVIAIGYQASNSLKINNKDLSEYTYDHNTLTLDGLSRVSGFGIAFPKKICGYEGEEEFAVGLGKFWATANDESVIQAWTSHNGRVPISRNALSYFQNKSDTEETVIVNTFTHKLNQS